MSNSTQRIVRLTLFILAALGVALLCILNYYSLP